MRISQAHVLTQQLSGGVPVPADADAQRSLIEQCVLADPDPPPSNLDPTPPRQTLHSDPSTLDPSRLQEELTAERLNSKALQQQVKDLQNSVLAADIKAEAASGRANKAESQVDQHLTSLSKVASLRSERNSQSQALVGELQVRGRPGVGALHGKLQSGRQLSLRPQVAEKKVKALEDEAADLRRRLEAAQSACAAQCDDDSNGRVKALASLLKEADEAKSAALARLAAVERDSAAMAAEILTPRKEAADSVRRAAELNADLLAWRQRGELVADQQDDRAETGCRALEAQLAAAQKAQALDSDTRAWRLTADLHATQSLNAQMQVSQRAGRIWTAAPKVP